MPIDADEEQGIGQEDAEAVPLNIYHDGFSLTPPSNRLIICNSVTMSILHLKSCYISKIIFLASRYGVWT